MDCQTAQSMIQRYIDHDLNLDELEEFIAHVKGCSSCYDELETYFTVSTAISHLDGDMDEELGTSMDMSRLLQQDLKKREFMVKNRRIKKMLGIFLCCFIVCVLTALALWILI
ncbi:MAG: anti-sigma factor family protein [Blautia sp.]|jgi:hypothetical protein